MIQTFENLIEELLQRHIKPSHQRIKVLEYLIAHQNHPTVDQIFNDLQKEIPTLSKSTVYNTLNVFVEARLLRVITIEDNEARYDILLENHGHFKCETCGTIYNFTINIDDFATDELKEFKINNKNVYFKGICPGCFKDKNKNTGRIIKMTTKTNEGNTPDCSTAGKGFARTENSQIASESCGLPARGFAHTDSGKQDEVTSEDKTVVDCSTAGMGFARTDKTKTASENCAFPSKGFGSTDFGKEK